MAARSMKSFHYVYILVSEAKAEVHYSGVTCDLRARIVEHNRAKCSPQRNTDGGKLRRQSPSDRKLKLAVLNAI
jgi:predicted GIY-YIG superfamily endonuclease